MKNYKYSITYILVSCVSLFLFYKALTDFLDFKYSHLFYGPFLIFYTFLLICSVLISFGKLKSNAYLNLGVIFALFISVFKYAPNVVSGFGVSYLISMTFPIIYLISLIFIIVGILKGRTKSIENISY